MGKIGMIMFTDGNLIRIIYNSYSSFNSYFSFLPEKISAYFECRFAKVFFAGSRDEGAINYSLQQSIKKGLLFK